MAAIWLAVDGAATQVSVLRIRPDGSLRAVEGGTVWSGGFEPISVTVSGGLVYGPTRATRPPAPAVTTPASL